MFCHQTEQMSDNGKMNCKTKETDKHTNASSRQKDKKK